MTTVDQEHYDNEKKQRDQMARDCNNSALGPPNKALEYSYSNAAQGKQPRWKGMQEKVAIASGEVNNSRDYLECTVHGSTMSTRHDTMGTRCKSWKKQPELTRPAQRCGGRGETYARQNDLL